MRDIDSGDRGVAGALLRQTRIAAGLTQSDFAALARTTQSAVAAYESGEREPTLPVFTRMIRAAGSSLEIVLHPDPSLYRLVDVARDISARPPGDEAGRLRHVFEFLRALSDDHYPPELVVGAEPPLTGDSRFDALLAAVAEDACVRANKTPPSWVHRPERFLDGAWWVSSLPSARALALVHTPASFRRRGVMMERRDLEAA